MKKEILRKIKKECKGWNKVLIAMFPEVFIKAYKKRCKRWI